MTYKQCGPKQTDRKSADAKNAKNHDFISNSVQLRAAAKPTSPK